MTAAFDYPGTFDADEADSVSNRVIARVAEVTETDPLELEPLYSTVDPDCLDAIFQTGGSTSGQDGGFIQFTMEGCRVVVSADGSVDVTPDAEESSGLGTGNATNASPETPSSPD